MKSVTKSASRYAVFFLIFVMILSFQPISFYCEADPDWLTGWTKRVKITIDSGDVDTVLTDFPVLIYLSDSSGINGSDVTFVFDEVGANYLKIAITLSDGTTECYAEIEKWDLGNEKAWIWTKISSISNITDTEIYLYYNNDHADNTAYVGVIESVAGKAVWDADFEAVAHLANDPSGAGYVIKGSTTNSIDGDPQGSWNSGDLVSGLAGDGLDFNAAVWILMNLNPTLYPATMEIWENSTVQIDNSRSNSMLSCRDDGIEEAGNIVFESRGGNFTREYYGAGDNRDWQGDTNYVVTYPDFQICDGIFHHIAIVVEASGSNRQATFYVDGVVVDNFVSTDNLVVGGDPLWLGKTFNPNNLFEGVLDEMRISATGRSEAWIKATYETCVDDLTGFGSQEILIETPAKLFGAGFNASAPSVILRWASNHTDINCFEIQNSTDKVSWDYLGSNTTTEYHDLQVFNGTERYYRVRACNFTDGNWYNSSFSDINFETVYFIKSGAAGAGLAAARPEGWVLTVMIAAITGTLIILGTRRRR